MTESQRTITWMAASEDGKGIVNTWTARFGAGYLVLHSSPTGAETMVYVPDSMSGLSEELS